MMGCRAWGQERRDGPMRTRGFAFGWAGADRWVGWVGFVAQGLGGEDSVFGLEDGWAGKRFGSRGLTTCTPYVRDSNRRVCPPSSSISEIQTLQTPAIKTRIQKVSQIVVIQDLPRSETYINMLSHHKSTTLPCSSRLIPGLFIGLESENYNPHRTNAV